MPNRVAYDPKGQIVSIGPDIPGGPMIPLVDLADTDDAIQASMNEDRYGDPAMDLRGEGQHQENANLSGKVTLTIKRTSIADLKALTLLEKTKATVKISCRDLSSQTAGFIGKGGKVARQPDYVRGKMAGDPQYVITCIKLEITHDGPRISPV